MHIYFFNIFVSAETDPNRATESFLRGGAACLSLYLATVEQGAVAFNSEAFDVKQQYLL